MIKDKLLSPRLQAIYDCIDEGVSVADIGTDHAYLPIALALNQKSATIYAVDNKQGPLFQAQKMVDFYDVSEHVVCSLVGQNKPYHDVDIWVIAGMGFQSVKQIILEYEQTIRQLKKIIIQVNHQVDKLREFCMDKRLHILDEIIVYDAFYYTILLVQYSEIPLSYSESEIQHGPILLAKRDAIFLKYCQYKKAQLHALLTKIPEHDRKWQHIHHQLIVIDDILNQ